MYVCVDNHYTSTLDFMLLFQISFTDHEDRLPIQSVFLKKCNKIPFHLLCNPKSPFSLATTPKC